jgi:hypothetical protein
MANIAPSAPNIAQALIAPEYQAQQAQAQRNYALAQAMRQQSMEDSTAPGGGRVSWAQGVARLAQALSAGVLNSRADKQSIAFGRALGGAVNGNFGIPPTGNPTSANKGANAAPPQALAAGLRGNTSAPQQAQAPAVAPSAGNTTGDALVPSAGYAPGTQMPSDRLAPLPDADIVPANVSQPDQRPQPSANGLLATQPPQSAQPSSTGATSPQQVMPQSVPRRAPWALTGDPYQDRAKWLLNGDEYGKAVIANDQKASALTDGEILINHARQAEASGDHATASSLAQQAFKLGYIPEVTHRGGSWGKDPTTGALQFYPNAPVNGAVATQGPHGMTWSLPEGTTQAVAGVKGAESYAEGQARSHFDYQPTYENNQPGTRSVWDMQHPNESSGASSGVPGTVAGFYGQSGGQGGGTGSGSFNPTGPRLGTTKAADSYGEYSGKTFGDIQQSAADVPQRISSLKEGLALVNSGAAATGPAAARFQEIGQKYGIDFLTRPGSMILNKDFARYVALSASDLGLSGSDARFGAVMHASPGQVMGKAALNTVVPTVIGLEMAKGARADAAGRYGTDNPNDIAGFQTQWRHNYDPTTFTEIAKGPNSFKGYLAHLKPAERNATLQKMRGLERLGVDFSQFAQ